ncbi:MAG: DMT family transporter [Planctomycetota bacterium]
MDAASVSETSIRIGAAAGLTTSLFWVLTSLFFAAAGRRIAVTWVNSIRIVFAILLLGGAQSVAFGSPVPMIGSAPHLAMLALSGLIGLSLCDQALFTAFVDIGPRRALLCMTTSPIFAVILGTVFLDERLGLVALAGILMTVVAVGFVVLERSGDAGEPTPRLRRGVILAMIGSVSQAVGGLCSRVGMGGVGLAGVIEPLPVEDQIPPLSATLVRMVFGLFGMTPIVLAYVVLARRGTGEREPSRWPAGLGLTACGAFVGPFLGVWMSLIAFKHAPLGIAQTMVSLSPVLILPFAYFLLKERVTPRAVLGAFIAVGGAAVLTFADSIQGWLGSLLTVAGG